MAKLEPGLYFTGSLLNISSYKRKDLDMIILRTKGGPSKRMIKKHPSFDMTRRNNAEFGGRSRATKWILGVLYSLKALSDYNIAGPLNAVLKPIQLMDSISEPGKRNIELSKNPGLLEGFQLNRRNVFEVVCRNPLSFTISKNERTAKIEIPALIPGTNFFPVDNYPVYRWQAALGVVPDLFHEDKMGYMPKAGFSVPGGAGVQTEWWSVKTAAPARIIELSFPFKPPSKAAFSLMLAVGISFGIMASADGEQVKYAGSGKILSVI